MSGTCVDEAKGAKEDGRKKLDISQHHCLGQPQVNQMEEQGQQDQNENKMDKDVNKPINKVIILRRQNLVFRWWQKRRTTLAQSVLKHLAPSTVLSITDSAAGRLTRSTNVPIVT